MATTPEKPANTFEEGVIPAAQQSKDALVKIVAEQGQYGLQQLQNREQNAAALGAQAPAVQGRDATTQALYDTFTRDSQQSQAQHGQEMGRIQAANTAYMDQAYGGIELQRKDMDAYYEAMRRAYEDKEAQRQAEMADRAAARRSAGGGGGSSPVAKLAAEMEGAGASTIPYSVSKQLGKTKPNMDLKSAFKAIGMDDGTIDVYMKKGVHKKHERMVNDVIQTAKAQDMTWDEILADIRVGLTDPAARAKYGLKSTVGDAKVAKGQVSKGMASYDAEYRDIIQPLLMMYAGDWGMSPQEWVQGFRASAPAPARNLDGTPARSQRSAPSAIFTSRR